MIVSFNSNIAKRNNPQTEKNANGVAFKRDVTDNELKALQEGKTSTYNTLRTLISATVVLPEDLSAKTKTVLKNGSSSGAETQKRWFSTICKMLSIL